MGRVNGIGSISAHALTHFSKYVAETGGVPRLSAYKYLTIIIYIHRHRGRQGETRIERERERSKERDGDDVRERGKVEERVEVTNTDDILHMIKEK